MVAHEAGVRRSLAEQVIMLVFSAFVLSLYGSDFFLVVDVFARLNEVFLHGRVLAWRICFSVTSTQLSASV